MTNARQLGAYPSLIPGNQEGAADPSKKWDVVELESSNMQDAGTSKEHRVIRLPKPVMRHDYWVRQHELTHVGRPWLTQGKNQLRNKIRQMIEEVAVDGQSLYRDLLDLRMARDKYAWAKFNKPQDVYQAAGFYFQIWTSAQVSKDAALLEYYADTVKLIQDKEASETKLTGLMATLEQAAEAVFADYSSGNCEDWADIVTAKLLGVPKEELPNAPEPAEGPAGSSDPSSGQSGSSTSTGGDSDPQERESGEQSGVESDDGEGSPTDPGRGGTPDVGECDSCAGTGVDDGGDDCADCEGTGVSGQAASERDSADAAGEPGATKEGSEAHQHGDSHSSWHDAPIDLNKARVNEPSEFAFDPLGKTLVDPNQEPASPELKTDRKRTQINKEQLQNAIDQERVSRKSGEAGQAEEITARTPHGAVDVHRHTLTKGVSATIALAWRSSEMGATVRYPANLFQGGRVFAKRAPGGAIILDCSGSMSWHTQHIVEAQKIMPNLYVAGYAYHGSNGYWKAEHGYISPDTYIARYCVLAAKGQLDPDGMAHLKSEWQQTGGNSGADPAALWYAASSARVKPIVWVSDGMVSFGENQEFYKQCDAIMRQHKIVRVLTIEDAIDYLLGKAVPGWHQCATVDTHWVRLGQPYMGRSIEPRHTYREANRWTQLRANSKKH